MRILVIGGTSFIGPHVIRSLSGFGHDVTVFHRGQHEADLPRSVRHVHSSSAAFPVVQFPAEVLREDPELVLHMVPMGAMDAQAVMRAFKGVARRVVAISSADVYRAYGVFNRTEAGPVDPTPLTEESTLRHVLYPYRNIAHGPEDWVYSYDKILVERAVMGDPDLPGTIMRLPAVYGPGDGQRRLFPYLKRMDDGRAVIPLMATHAHWRWTHGYVENVALAIALAVTDERAADRIYNIGDATTPTTADWVRTVGRAAGWAGDVVAVPRERFPAQRRDDHNFDQDLVTDSTRIRLELGYHEPVPLATALERTIAWERAHPPPRIDPAKFDYAAEDAFLADQL